MFAYNPTVNDESGAILASGKIGAAQANSQMMQGLGEDIGGALSSIGGVIGGSMKTNKEAKSTFEGNYRFLTDRGILPSNAQNAVLDFVERKDFQSANAMIAPYLAELDFGRKSMLAGRSGFFDSSGAWQMALRPEPVNPPNKEGYIYMEGR